MTEPNEEQPNHHESPNRLIEWSPVAFAQSGIMYWINSRILWPLGIELQVDAERDRLYVQAYEQWVVLGFNGDRAEEDAWQRQVLEWIAGRVSPSTPASAEPAEEPAPTTPAPTDGSPAGPVH